MVTSIRPGSEGSEEPEDDMDAQISQAFGWLRITPGKSAFVRAAILGFMYSRGAVGDGPAISSEELNQLETYLTKVHEDISLIAAMSHNQVMVHMVDGKPVSTPK